MRIILKRKAAGLTDLIAQAHTSIKEALENRDIFQALGLLEDCQRGMIALGDLLEKEEGANCPTIVLMEEYCELVFRVYENAQAGRNTETAYALLQSSLDRIIKSIGEDVVSNFEVVFLPYKSSMWDSLESVWQAAAADERCNAYVIPIPYFDRNPDGTFGEMHYEGNAFPPDVPVIDYRTYNFENRHPDIIFIHNPFDDYNYVTSVLPDFYTHNLKKYTEKLLYIPYFDTGGGLSRSFRELPSYNFIDYIVTQSKRQNECYADSVREKLLPLGSPKFDRVLNCHIDNMIVPASWKERLTHKVFLYNTSISSIFDYGDIALQKMIYVFEEFSKMDATLIWRPHPLLKETIAAMRPDLMERYELAEKAFSRVGHGIMDTSPDPTLAVMLSDAYVGEGTSSIAHLFGVLGKPICLTNMKVTKNYDEETRYFKIFGCAVADGALWAPAGDRNCLVKIARDGTVEETYEIPGETNERLRLYNSIIYEGQKLYLIPHSAKEIAVFDLNSKTFTKIPIASPQESSFSRAHLYRGRIYMIPVNYPSLIELNCATGQITYHSRIMQELMDILNTPRVCSFNGSILEGGELIIPSGGSGHVSVINLDAMKYTVYQVGQKNHNYLCAAGKDGKFILGSDNGRRLTFWDRNTGETKELTDYPFGWEGDHQCFYDMACLEKTVYVFPKSGNMILKISLDTLRMTGIRLDRRRPETARKNGYYSWHSNYLLVKKLNERQIIVQSAYQYGLTLLDQDGAVQHSPVCLPADLPSLRCEKAFRPQKRVPWAMRETVFQSLKKFVQYVNDDIHDRNIQLDHYKRAAVNLDGTCGAKIYHEAVRKLGVQLE